MMKIAGHRLAIANPKGALDFYQNKLGMLLIAQHQFEAKMYYFLSFESVEDADLILVHDPLETNLSVAEQPNLTEGYWKFSISVSDVDRVRQRLIEKQVAIGDSFEVPDIAYLCHLTDTDGYCIELIQHQFRSNFHPMTPDQNYVLGCRPLLNLSTLRVKDIAASLRFYESLGMTLVSRQQIPTRGVTLYFLSFNQEAPPSSDIDALSIREWLWQRPYTLLELQHIHGTENRPDFCYQTGSESGFLGLDINLKSTSDLPVCKDAKHKRFVTSTGITSGITIHDPDGHSMHLYSQQ